MRATLALLALLLLAATSPAAATSYVVWSPEKAVAEIRALDRDIRALAVHGLKVKDIRTYRTIGAAAVVDGDERTAELLRRRGYRVEVEVVVRPATESWAVRRVHERVGTQRATPRFSGSNVRIAILDSGVDPAPIFADRLLPGFDAVKDGKGTSDCAGHGTPVASLAASAEYGTSEALIVPIRVLDCTGNGHFPALMAGYEWLLAQAEADRSVRWVANMSFGAVGRMTSEGEVLNRLVAAGVILFASAGNNGTDACGHTPAHYPQVIAVGGTTRSDELASFSNRGPCVDLLAPAASVPAQGGAFFNYAEGTGNGTSSAAPLAAGVAATLLERLPNATVADIHRLILGNATRNAIAGLPSGTPNLLLYASFEEKVTTFFFRWKAETREGNIRFVGSTDGQATPSAFVDLFRGPAIAGACQGKPFARLKLANGDGLHVQRGWVKAPAAFCVETELGLVAHKVTR